MHYYTFDIKKFYHGARNLSKLERWHYFEMLNIYYDKEEGFKVEEIDHLMAELDVETAEEEKAVHRVLKKKFLLIDNVWINSGCESVLDHYHASTASKSKAGKASALARAKKKALADKASKQKPTGVEQNQTSAANKELTINNKKDIDQEDLDQLFEKFWNAGMRRVGKKKCKPIFKKIIHDSDILSPSDVADYLVQDIKIRIKLNQFGFEKMHPQTYLNGERWNDEHTETTKSNTSQGASSSEAVSQAIASALGQEESNADMADDG